MEVAASLPNVMKVFPLRIMVTGDFPALKHVSFSSEAAVPNNADEEMEEGEIDLKDTCGHEGGYGIRNEQQYSCAYSEANPASTVSAAPRSPTLSVMNNNVQLECSVDALLSFSDKLSAQRQSRFCSSQSPSLQGNQCQACSPAQCSSSGQAAALMHASLQVKQFSSRPNLSAAAMQSQACLPPFYSPSNPTEASLRLKKLQALSPQSKQPSADNNIESSSPFKASSPPADNNIEAFSLFGASSPQAKQSQAPFRIKVKLRASSPQSKQSQLSPRADSSMEASSPLKASSPQSEQPQVSLQIKKVQASFPQPKQPPLSPPADNYVEASLPIDSSSPQAKQPYISSAEGNNPYPRAERQTFLSASGKQLLEGFPRSPAQAADPLKHNNQAPLPNLSHPVGSIYEKKPEVYQGLPNVQLSLQTLPPVMTQVHGQRALITCINGKKRPRSSAVRDYPEGCGKNVSAKVCNMQAEHDKSSICHDKAGLKMQDVKDHISPDHVTISLTKQVRKEKKLPHQEANPRRPALMMGDTAALCLYKSLKTSATLPKRPKAHVSLKRKPDAKSPMDPLLQQAPKKHKVRHISRILSSAEVDPSPSIPHEQKIQANWLQDYDYELAASAESLVKANNGASARSLVKKTLQEFDCVRRSLAMCKDRPHRPDLVAARILKAKGRYRNYAHAKIVGEVPGVEVGDQFSFRIEMLIIGLHRQVQGGIDFITGSVRPEGPLATSIVASGGYEDDDDCGDTFIYTGQGGNNYKGDRRQACDQVLARGNLALSNCFKENSPVRVIRGSADDKFYTYDGLYDVIDCWFQTGAAGYGVYQFKLSRRPGQPALGSSIVRFMGTVKKGLVRPHVLTGDLSHGKEMFPICVINEVDEEVAPQYFTYIPKMKYPSWYLPDISKGCGCVGGCVDASKCLCAAKNGGEFPYNEFGEIVRGKQVVFECGKSCACSRSCHNRVSQRGPQHQLEVFKTRKRGWGVRSLEPIKPGGFICEYVGELLSDADAEQRIERDEYLFDIGNKTTAWSDVSDLMDIMPEKAIGPIVEDAGYAIDARLFGSVARFINHSCSPNLFAQNVVYDTDDLRFPHVLLFSMENIPPLRELSYDYNYTVGHVRDANGNVKSKACYCGAQDCRGRLY